MTHNIDTPTPSVREHLGDSEPEREPPPERLGRYPVTGYLGGGGMGEVLRVWDDELRRGMAAKVIAGQIDRTLLERFVLEAQVTGQLEHPNIVPVHELGLTEDGRIYFTMKEVQGRTLSSVLGALRKLPPGEARHKLVGLLQIFLKVCDAMALAHDRGVIHRDLKPANIMVGEFGEVLVMDWGLAKVTGQPDPRPATDVEGAGANQSTLRAKPIGPPGPAPGTSSSMTQDGAVIGTPAYMSPEQADGRVAELDERSDIYSLGAILYEVLTLAPPYEGDSAWTVIERVITEDPTPPSQRAPERSIPWELEAVVCRAMSRYPADRYAKVTELQADIESFLAGRTLSAADYSTVQLVGKWVVRNKAASIVAAVSILVGSLVIGGLQWRRTAAAEKKVVAQVQTLRPHIQAQLDRLEVHKTAVPSLLQPNGEKRWDEMKTRYEIYIDVINQLDRLAELDREAPTDSARRAIDLPWVNELRSRLCIEAARQAAEVGAYVEARNWIGRATSSHLSDADRTAQLEYIDSLRTASNENLRARARELLVSVRKPTNRVSFDINLAHITRYRKPTVVRLLLSRTHLDSPHEWERRLAIEALGVMADTSTRGEEGLDPVEALLARLETATDLELMMSIAKALGLIQDSRAYMPLHRLVFGKGRRALQFGRRARRYLLQIPLPDRLANPRTGKDHHERGVARSASGEYDGAIADFTRAMELGLRDRALAYNNRGLAFHARRDHDAAIADFTRAIGLDDRRAWYYHNRGISQLQSRRPRKAIDDFNAALSLDPELAAAFCYRALGRMELGDNKGALGDLDAAIIADPDYLEAYYNRGVAHTVMRNYTAALRDYSTTIRLDPARRDALVNRAALRFMHRDYSGVIADLDRALRIDPGDPKAYYTRGAAREKSGDLGGAKKDYDTAIRIKPDYAYAFTRRGTVHLLRRDWAAARSDFTRAIALGPAERQKILALLTRTHSAAPAADQPAVAALLNALRR